MTAIVWAEPLQLWGIPVPTPFPVGDAVIYLHQGERLTLFDAGVYTQTAWEALIAGLSELRLNVSDIEAIVLTHHHLDHIGLSRRVRDASGARVCAHPRVSEQLRHLYDETHARTHMESLLRELGVPREYQETVIQSRMQYRQIMDDFVVDESLADGTRFGPFTVHHRPGHSATDTVYLHEGLRCAITGDHLLKNVTPNPILRRCAESGKREKSLVQYCESLERTRLLEADWCFPGHGKPFQQHRDIVASTFRHIERRNLRILAQVPAQGITPYEVMKKLFPRFSGPELYYCLSAATGHLELLEMQDRLYSGYNGGVLHFFAFSAPCG